MICHGGFNQSPQNRVVAAVNHPRTMNAMMVEEESSSSFRTSAITRLTALKCGTCLGAKLPRYGSLAAYNLYGNRTTPSI